MAISVQVRLASVRRSLFTNEGERSKFLNHLVTGTRDILRGQIGLTEHENYHEFCRLLGRLKTNYQLNELVSRMCFLALLHILIAGCCHSYATYVCIHHRQIIFFLIMNMHLFDVSSPPRTCFHNHVVLAHQQELGQSKVMPCNYQSLIGVSHTQCTACLMTSRRQGASSLSDPFKAQSMTAFGGRRSTWTSTRSGYSWCQSSRSAA